MCTNFGEFTLTFNELRVHLVHLLTLHMYVTQNWLRSNCSDFTNKNEWPPNLPNFNSLDYYVWGHAVSSL